MHDAMHDAMHARMHARTGARGVPAWLRETAGEPRWQAMVAVALMVALQLRLPADLAPQMGMPGGQDGPGRWLLPGVQIVLGLVLVAANPRRIDHASRRLRALGLALLGVASLANALSAAALVHTIVTDPRSVGAEQVLLDGGTIWVTNVLVFGLWYWELDRGGPGARARAEQRHPDFVFPQMSNPDMADPDWEPHVGDYLYLAFTNATAFSPTDTVPFSRWSKSIMTAQSSVSLIVGALVIARAVNALG
jgi:uncharacterized membrane protein